MLDALGVRLRLELDPEQAQQIKGRLARRDERQVRDRLSQAIIDRARPYVMAELGLIGDGQVNGAVYKG